MILISLGLQINWVINIVSLLFESHFCTDRGWARQPAFPTLDEPINQHSQLWMSSPTSIPNSGWACQPAFPTLDELANQHSQLWMSSPTSIPNSRWTYQPAFPTLDELANQHSQLWISPITSLSNSGLAYKLTFPTLQAEHCLIGDMSIIQRYVEVFTLKPLQSCLVWTSASHWLTTYTARALSL